MNISTPTVLQTGRTYGAMNISTPTVLQTGRTYGAESILGSLWEWGEPKYFHFYFNNYFYFIS
jgi:hypothetical protein